MVPNSNIQTGQSEDAFREHTVAGGVKTDENRTNTTRRHHTMTFVNVAQGKKRRCLSSATAITPRSEDTLLRFSVSSPVTFEKRQAAVKANEVEGKRRID